jgi:hypothetical protein
MMMSRPPKEIGSGRRRKSVPTEVENKAIFSRYAEEVGNKGNLELADEIFDRYVSHQPDGSVLQRGPEVVKRFNREFSLAFPGDAHRGGLAEVVLSHL